MAFSNFQRKNFTFWKQGTRSNPETLSRSLDFESDTIVESTKSVPGMWCYPTNHEHCCIYRVPERLRRVNPEAYTPQLLLIGPLHHHLRSQAFDITNTKSMGYLNMEEHKKIYLAEFAKRLEDKITIDWFRETIKAEEETIRASYSESTSWIKSPEFVEMILLDSVFIVEFIMKSLYRGSKTTGDIIVDKPCLQLTVREDLILLENQLPYFILEKLFDPIYSSSSLRNSVIIYFGFRRKIGDDSKFRHFTDLHRCARVETLGSEKPAKPKFRYLASLFRCVRMKTDESKESTKSIFKNFTDFFHCGCVDADDDSRADTVNNHMYNAEKLYSGGVEFVAMKNELSIDVRFENGYLKIPFLRVSDGVEIKLRNIMALEQCHYPFDTYVCNFVNFLDLLIDNEKDIDLLIEKGILNNWIGEHSLVAHMVNKLCLGVVEYETSCYSDIVSKVNAYYENPINRSRAVLGRMYFSNVWTGTATVAATLLLVMTLIQTVTSIIQVIQK